MTEADDAAARQAAEVAVELSEADQPAERRRVLGKLNQVAVRAAAAVRRGAGSAASGARRRASGAQRGEGRPEGGAEVGSHPQWAVRHRAGAGLNWLTAQVLAMGPRLRIRNQDTLRVQFPGRSEDQIADLLIARAARAAAAVGGATGAWAALPSLPSFPVEIAAETLAVVGIEVKLVAELHEVYGMPAEGNGADRARAYIGAWASRSGVYRVHGGLLLVAGSPMARQLRRRLAARVRRSTFSLSPLFTGAVAGAMLNRREVWRLGKEIRDELRKQRTTVRAEVLKDQPPADPGD